MSDLIDRQAAIDAMAELQGRASSKGELTGISKAWKCIKQLPSAQPKPSAITDEQAILHLQSTGWMQNHDREMYESGLKKRLADDSGDYDSLIPCEDTISRQQTITALRALSDDDGYINAPHEVVTDVVRGLPPVKVKHEQTAPSEQTETDKSGVKTGETCEDCISRQAAIDIERNATVDTNPSHFEAHQKFTQFLDDAEISSFGRWQWSNGFNTALTAVGIDLRRLPPAQPEQTEMIKEIRKWINSANRGNADYFIVDKIEEIINRYE